MAVAVQIVSPLSEAALQLQSARCEAEAELALGLPRGMVGFLLAPRGPLYVPHRVRKPSGGIRLLSEPIRDLKRVQRAIADLLAEFYSPPASAYGYVRERDIVKNAKCHVGAAWLLNLDLKDFFSSIHVGRVAGALQKRLGFTREAAWLVARLCCDGSLLPQGAPTSPILSNVVCLGMDEALDRLAARYGCTNTRWVDDLSFSRREGRPPKALWDRDDRRLGDALLRVVAESGFKVNPKKTSFAGPHDSHCVTGIITKPHLTLRQVYFREVRAMLHSWERHGLAAAQRGFEARVRRKEPPRFEKALRGKIEHIGHVRGRQDARYLGFLRHWEQLADRDGAISRRQAQPATSA